MIDIQIDPIRYLKSLRNTLVQNKKPIGFLLSAGCPLSIKDADSQPLIPDMKGLSACVEKELSTGLIADSFKKMITELMLCKGNKNNLEDILSFIRSLHEVSKGGIVRGLSEKDLVQLEKEICRLIVDKVNVSHKDSDTPYHKFARWISSIDRDTPVEIFTTNYDLLIEQALEETGIPYFDGFTGARQPFFDLKAVEENLIPSHWTRFVENTWFNQLGADF